jgi:hypothetical protein
VVGLQEKSGGKPSGGNPHARFDETDFTETALTMGADQGIHLEDLAGSSPRGRHCGTNADWGRVPHDTVTITHPCHPFSAH